MKVGTPEHRDLFCGSFIDGHVTYEPENIPWPSLEQKYLDRLRAIPFWGIAKAMERKAGIMVSAFAQTLEDPLIRDAVALQGTEETRHAHLMTHFIERYGLRAPEVALSAGDPVKEQFVVFGYEECVDFFMGAGLFRLATRLDIFPANLVSIFERVLVEEARHVTFFINWIRYRGSPGRARRNARTPLHGDEELLSLDQGNGALVQRRGNDGVRGGRCESARGRDDAYDVSGSGARRKPADARATRSPFDQAVVALSLDARCR
jgi:hypothetical protein